MKYTILVFLRKVIAALTAMLAALCAGKPTPVQPERPAENTVAAYSEADADYALSIGADAEIDEISELLFGIFFEDINFAADGGLYAEMAVNRSFEFNAFAAGDQLYGWSAVNGAALQVVTDQPQNALNENNPNFVTVKNDADTPAGLANCGFLDGMAIAQGAKYKLSFYAKSDSYSGDVTARLCVGNETAAEATVRIAGDGWTKYEAVLTADRTAHENVSLQLLIGTGDVCFDMISLFPEDTYKGRDNGLRKDLGQMLEEMHPRFLRFPGGCVIEGYDKTTAYNWKDSIGVGRDGLPLPFGGTYGDDYSDRVMKEETAKGDDYDDERFTDYLFDQNDYTLSDGSHVKVSTAYDYVYEGDNGVVYYSDSAFAQPGGSTQLYPNR